MICFLSDGNCNCRDFWFGAIVAIVHEMRWGLHPSVPPSCTTNSHHIHEGSKSMLWMLCGGRLTSMLACVLFQCARMRVQVCAFAFTTFHAYTPLYTKLYKYKQICEWCTSIIAVYVHTLYVNINWNSLWTLLNSLSLSLCLDSSTSELSFPFKCK